MNFTGILPPSVGYNLPFSKKLNANPANFVGFSFPTSISQDNVQTAIENLVSNELTPYIVGTDSKYTSIQSAIDAAVADGASDSNPSLVLVKFGTYTEDISLVAGVYLQGLSNCAIQAFGVTVIGDITGDYIGMCTMDNISLQGSLTISGTGASQFASQCCNYTAGENVAITFSNPNCLGTFSKCYIQSSNGAVNNTVNIIATQNVSFILCQFQPNQAYTVFGAINVAANVTLFNGFMGIPATVAVGGMFQMFYIFSLNQYTPPDTTPMITCDGECLMLYCTVGQFNSTTDFIDGSGNLSYSNVAFLNPALTIGGGITATALTTI